MKVAGSVCKFDSPFAEDFKKHGEWFSNQKVLEERGIMDPGWILAKKFELLFDRKIEDFEHMTFTKSDANAFRKELEITLNSIRKGKMHNKLGEMLWSTSERAKAAPQFAALHNEFMNISHRNTGYQTVVNRFHSRILDSLASESIAQNLTKSTMFTGDRKAFYKALKKGQEFEDNIERLQEDVHNNVPGAEGKLENAVDQRTEYLVSGERKVFYEFINLI